MKLTLSKDRNVDILNAAGAIEERDVKILKVGITKLIKDGKNQVAIEISEPRVPTDLLRDLVELDLLARELSGRVVIIALSAELKTQVETYSNPPTLGVFSDRDSACAHFESLNAAPLAPIPTTTAEGLDLAAVAGDVSAAVTPTNPAQAAEEQKKYKEDIRKRELTDIGDLRKTIARLEEENKALLTQMETLVADRRAPPNEAAYIERVRDLEDKLVRLMEDLGKAQEKPK